MALFEFKLPDIGEGVMEGEIVKWLVKPGDTVREDDGVVEVMTDKASVTIPTPRAGKVVRTHGKEGEIARVHHPLVDLEIDGAVPTPSAPRAEPDAAATAPAPSTTPAERVLATPLTRRMAREHGLDLTRVQGTGANGRVLKADVEAVLSTGQAAAQPEPQPPPVVPVPVATRTWTPLPRSAGDERIPIRGLRKRIAEKMVKSKFTAPHYTFVEEVDASQLVAMRERMNGLLEKDGLKLSFLPFFVKASIAALRAFPQVNAVMDEAQQELVVRGQYNIGIAAMTEQGLTVPVLHGADRLGLTGLAREIARLGQAARDQKLKLEELSGSTFTITSLGQTGGLFATPIINHPEVAIMGIHKMRKRPIVEGDEDRVVVRPMVILSFSFDHRVIDGAMGAEFAYEVIRHVEHPDRLFLD